MTIKTLGFSLLTGGVLAAGTVSAPALAQAFVSGVDRTLPRLCKNSCVQSNEQMVVDGSGNAVAVWNEPYTDGSESYSGLVGARYTAATNSWSAPKILWWSYTGMPLGKLGMDANGNATMLFALNMGYGKPDYQMVAVRWIAGFGWQTSNAAVEYGWEPNSPIEAAVGRNGHVFATYGVDYSGRYERSSGSRTLLYSPSTKTWTLQLTSPGFDQIVADPYGSAIGFHLYGNQILTKRFDTATRTWVTGGVIEYLGNYTITQFNAVADRSGNMMAIYEKKNSTTGATELKTARYQGSTRKWSIRTLPKISSSRVYGKPSIASDRYGNYYATWVQYSGSYQKTIASRYSNSGAYWSRPLVISKGNYHTRDASVVTDYAGNAIHAWSQRTDSGTGSSYGKVFRTTAVRYSNWKWGWPSAVQDSYRIGYKPIIGADNNGRTVVIWMQNSSVSGVKELKSDRLIPR